ncbi:NAD(P)/FAD-dependent oxidoreductase [Algicella marina]|uniref:NAD(P)/FAD-dependent oxidoreductase n=1 Tax=Algicella marina TaxID=2683284 RepID=A0A6P1T2G6_9RHOB|nr:NAD(P)/FAD-dependent oxidoreductase [Algicella marina]QHQ36908.1 NAD(P)/FAD-dependent oxidoreductase [Algicella marina]
MKINRRDFVSGSVATGALLAAPAVTGQSLPRVVIIGGGAGGATAARYIAKDSAGEIDVVLIEPTRTYYTCFFSNLYLGGFRDLASIGHNYGKLAAEYGITVLHDWATGIDREAQTVSLAGGNVLSYDKLVISPGIDFIEGSIPGWKQTDQTKMPHAFKAGSQTELLRAQVLAMREGGTFALIAPPNPYRCPPGPYERVSMVAHLMKQSNPTAKILIVDPKESFSKQALFEEGWNAHYPGMIERVGPDFGGDKVEVRPGAMEVVIDGEVEAVDVCNVVPAMKAGHICEKAGITEGNWAPVVPATMASRVDENIHVLGDSADQGDMPKSAFSANSQAKVCAMAVRSALTGSRTFPARFANTCWSLIDENDGVKVGATYEATEDKIARIDGFVSQPGEDRDIRQQTFEESLGWYDAITADMFG